MRNNFDVLEGLSNIDGMRSIPLDGTVNVFDLIYKTKCILEEKARLRKMMINLSGERPIIHGSQKSFPTVINVLLENAIKYGRTNSTIDVSVDVIDRTVKILVSNESDFPIDATSCFNKGSRYAGDAVEGGGLGLYLAKQIVLAHSGTIQCEREERIIRMVVELPLKVVLPRK